MEHDRSSKPFRLVSEFPPTGDQPQAIDLIARSVQAGNRWQTLLGVTGSGKTFSMANVIARVQRPTLIISHNKTLAAQLYSEFKHFFPENAVEYFISYYDYYQPEAYVPATDTYIEKDSAVNDDLERLRIAAASALLSRRDVIVIASVSCIYGSSSPDDFNEMMIPLEVGMKTRRDELLEKFVRSLYRRDDVAFERGTFRVRGDTIDVFPADRETAIRISLFDDEIESIRRLDPLTGRAGARLEKYDLYPSNQYVTPQDRIETAIGKIQAELEEQVAKFEREGKLLEAQRIRMRTENDVEMLRETGFCFGIENYSMHLGGRTPEQRPWCLIDFFPKDFLVFIDESHVTLPQIYGMSNGDRSRKERLVEFGFRLPSAVENRPLRPEEFQALVKQTVFVSATPAAFELEHSAVVAEQIIRPTGLLDPVMEVRPIKGQVEDAIHEATLAVERGERVLVTTLTKRMSEDLCEFMRERGMRAEYLHSDIDAIERVEILRRLRRGAFDVLIGVNLLREGLDIPEAALVVILDADKEGFLRSETSIVQTAGRAARHENGRVILYADVMTQSLARAIAISRLRRERQMEYNAAHGITPRGVRRAVQESLLPPPEDDAGTALMAAEGAKDEDVAAVIAELEEEMLAAADRLEFEKAALLRDQISLLKKGAATKPAPAKPYAKPSRKKRRP
ncbi:excinuclease ABC subunit UvrB [Candidatus Spyradosoma sp. SGI.093]|uniref:excinuclease ABC subunit UvrB n=1 Tax=Candidatus Spyradosoma sp. SGI.093 TaxID=3420583 RepID=UPI003D05B145